MKVKDFKTLLHDDPRTAMLFDLTERFPRGPQAKLRDRDYKDVDTGEILEKGWGSNTAPYLNRGLDTANGSAYTGGWDPYLIYELPDSEWSVQTILEGLEVPTEIAMGDGWYVQKEDYAKLFKRGAQLTRRARRAANRIRMAREWVKQNITTAVYKVSSGYYSRHDVYVHADNEEGARTQFETFMAAAFNKHTEGFNEIEDRGFHVSYVRPAKTPMELMALNQPFIDNYVASIEKKRQRIIELQKEIEAMDTAQQMVNIYAINMVASWGTGEGEDADA